MPTSHRIKLTPVHLMSVNPVTNTFLSLLLNWSWRSKELNKSIMNKWKIWLSQLSVQTVDILPFPYQETFTYLSKVRLRLAGVFVKFLFFKWLNTFVDSTVIQRKENPLDYLLCLTALPSFSDNVQGEIRIQGPNYYRKENCEPWFYLFFAVALFSPFSFHFSPCLWFWVNRCQYFF